MEQIDKDKERDTSKEEISKLSDDFDQSLVFVADEIERNQVDLSSAEGQACSTPIFKKSCADVLAKSLGKNEDVIRVDLASPGKHQDRNFTDVVILVVATKGRPKNSKTTNVIGLRKNFPSKSATAIRSLAETPKEGNNLAKKTVPVNVDRKTIGVLEKNSKDVAVAEVRKSSRKRIENPKYKHD